MLTIKEVEQNMRDAALIRRARAAAAAAATDPENAYLVTRAQVLAAKARPVASAHTLRVAGARAAWACKAAAAKA